MVAERLTSIGGPSWLASLKIRRWLHSSLAPLYLRIAVWTTDCHQTQPSVPGCSDSRRVECRGCPIFCTDERTSAAKQSLRSRVVFRLGFILCTLPCDETDDKKSTLFWWKTNTQLKNSNCAHFLFLFLPMCLQRGTFQRFKQCVHSTVLVIACVHRWSIRARMWLYTRRIK